MEGFGGLQPAKPLRVPSTTLIPIEPFWGPFFDIGYNILTGKIKPVLASME
jgi:hypothetical protein